MLLLALGAAWDLWRARHPVLRPLPTALPVAERADPDSARPGGEGPRVDLNRAGVEELDTLPGIGPVLARRIVDHRAAYGPFARPEDLLAVRGIGPRLLARLRDRVTAGSPPRP